MNKKIVFCNENKELFYCILSTDKDFDAQLNRLIYGEEDPKHGVYVHLNEDTLDFIDYYHAERMAYHQIVRIEDTNEDVSMTFYNQ